MKNTSKRIEELISEYPLGATAQVRRFKKASGKSRVVLAPDKQLNKWLQDMNHALNDHFDDWPSYMHGGIRGRSCISFARPHVRRACLIRVDVRECFPSISARQVSDTFKKHLGLTPDLCQRLAALLCSSGSVAQGYATSNFVSNLYLLDPLANMVDYMAENKLNLSNYVDDIGISGNISRPDDVINKVALELSRSKLSISKIKVKVMPSSKRMEICGLVVNKRITITKSKKRELFAAVNTGSISEESLQGWLAHLNAVDRKYGSALFEMAIDRGYKVGLKSLG